MSTLLERQARYQAGPSPMLESPSSHDSSHLHSSFSQPATAEYDMHCCSRTLPRPRQNRKLTAPHSTPQAANGSPSCNPASPRRQLVSSAASAPVLPSRRQLVSNAVSDYLKSLNSMTRSIVLEKECVEERHEGEWSAMDEILQEEVVDDHFMPSDVRAHYGNNSPIRKILNRHEDEIMYRNLVSICVCCIAKL